MLSDEGVNAGAMLLADWPYCVNADTTGPKNASDAAEPGTSVCSPEMMVESDIKLGVFPLLI